MPIDPPNGVHSEIGRLRRVLVCEPGLAHRRLTPTNASDLLFDDVLWVENAIADHRAFVAELRARDVEVLELHEPRQLAEFLVGGLATVDITGGFDDDHFALAEYSPDAREYVMPPLP